MPRKRTYQRRKRRYARKSRFNRMVSDRSPIAKTMRTKMRYVDSTSMDPPAAGVSTALVYRANGLYDPYAGAGGHQPYGFDQLIALYRHFHVVSAKITAVFVNQNSTDAYRCGVYLSDSVTSITDANTIMESGDNSWTFVGNSTGTSVGRCSKTFSAKKCFGVAGQALLANDQLKGSISADPVEQQFFHVWAAASNGASDEAYIDVNVIIEYNVVLTDAIALTGS